MFAFGLAIFLVYLVMASQFESLLHPFVIMFSIPLGDGRRGAGAVAVGSPVSVVVFIGLILLVGIVVKNAIVLIDRVNQLREEGVCQARGDLPGRRIAPAPDRDDHAVHAARLRAAGLRSAATAPKCARRWRSR